MNQAFINVAKNQSETIVSIVSTKTEKVNNMFFFNPFEDFDFGQDPYQQEREAQSLGSGVIINKNDGYIITNNHVIEGAEEVKVVLYDKREISLETFELFIGVHSNRTLVCKCERFEGNLKKFFNK